MYKIKALAKMYGLSSKQARDRVTALRPLIDAYTHDGKDNAIQYTEQGRAMLDRLLQIERDSGVTIKAAAERVKEEFQDHFPYATHGQADADLVDRLRELETQLEEQADTYEKRIADLQRTITKHDGRLSEVEEQVQYMLEAPKGDTDAGAETPEHEATVSTAEATAHDPNRQAATDEPHEANVPTEIAVDGNLPRWRRALANLPLLSRMLS